MIRWLLVLVCLCVASSVDAQRKPRAKKAAAQTQHSEAPTKRVKRKAPSKKKLAPKTEAQLPQTPTPEQRAAGSAPPASATPTDPSQIRTEGDTQVKIMEFSGLDIEGQLKTPQMLYFLNRLRAEFGHPSLPHRSFMPELQQATETDAFR